MILLRCPRCSTLYETRQPDLTARVGQPKPRLQPDSQTSGQDPPGLPAAVAWIDWQNSAS